MGQLLRLRAAFMIVAATLAATLTVTALSAAFATPAAAGQITMYAARSPGSPVGPGDVITLDPVDASQLSLIGNPTTGGGITGLDFDATGGLWGSTLGGLGSTSNLIRIDPDTGALLQDVGPIHTNAGNVAGSAISIGDLAYDRTTQTLFGIQSLDQTPAVGGNIYTIDVGTGLASLVGPTIWGTTAGIAFDSAGVFYALGFDPAVGPFGTNMLFTLDPADATELSRVTVSLNDFVFSGLGIDPLSGGIYATEDDFFATGTGTGKVYTVDPVSGAMTFVGKPAGVVSDIAFRIAAPDTLAILAPGLLGLLLARRRRVG